MTSVGSVSTCGVESDYTARDKWQTSILHEVNQYIIPIHSVTIIIIDALFYCEVVEQKRRVIDDLQSLNQLVL